MAGTETSKTVRLRRFSAVRMNWEVILGSMIVAQEGMWINIETQVIKHKKGANDIYKTIE